MILGKSDKNKIYHLAAMNNTDGLCVESSFHVPKSGLPNIWYVQFSNSLIPK